MTNYIKTPREWQEWLKARCQKHFPALYWEYGSENAPFIYGMFPDLERERYSQDMGIEVGIIANCVTGETTFSISLVPDIYDASDNDSHLFPLSRGRATIDEAISETKVTFCNLSYRLRTISEYLK